MCTPILQIGSLLMAEKVFKETCNYAPSATFILNSNTIWTILVMNNFENAYLFRSSIAEILNFSREACDCHRTKSPSFTGEYELAFNKEIGTIFSQKLGCNILFIMVKFKKFNK